MNNYNKTVKQILINDLTTAVDILKNFESGKHRLHTILFNYRDPNDGEQYGWVPLNKCNTDPHYSMICRMVEYHKNFRIHRIRGVYGAGAPYYVDIVRENGKWDFIQQEVVDFFVLQKTKK